MSAGWSEIQRQFLHLLKFRRHRRDIRGYREGFSARETRLKRNDHEVARGTAHDAIVLYGDIEWIRVATFV